MTLESNPVWMISKVEKLAYKSDQTHLFRISSCWEGIKKKEKKKKNESDKTFTYNENRTGKNKLMRHPSYII